MHRQRWLAFVDQVFLEVLWERFPQPARREVTAQYARLMARMLAARLQRRHPNQEVGDEPRHR